MSSEQFLAISKSIADPSRLAALELIARRGEVTCSDVRDRLDLTPATVSHHVKELIAAGLVRQRREAKFLILALETSVWEDYLRELGRRIPNE